MVFMEPTSERDATKLVVVLLRHLHGQSQRELEAVSGVDQKRISRYELGQVTPRRSTLERLSGAVGISPVRLDQLLHLCGQICEESAAHSAQALRPATPASPEPASSAGAGEVPEDALPELAAEVVESLEPLILEGLSELEALVAAPSPPRSAEEERSRAAELWRHLEPLLPRQRRLVIQHGREYRTWAVCERLCAESRTAAPTDPDRAFEWAEIALAVAEQTVGAKRAKSGLQAYALAAFSEAQSAQGDLEEAAATRRRAEELWLGTGAAPAELDAKSFDESLFAKMEPGGPRRRS